MTLHDEDDDDVHIIVKFTYYCTAMWWKAIRTYQEWVGHNIINEISRMCVLYSGIVWK